MHPYNPKHFKSIWFGLFPFRSPLLRESHFDFYSCWYLDGSVPSVFLYYAILFT